MKEWIKDLQIGDYVMVRGLTSEDDYPCLVIGLDSDGGVIVQDLGKFDTHGSYTHLSKINIGPATQEQVQRFKDQQNRRWGRRAESPKWSVGDKVKVSSLSTRNIQVARIDEIDSDGNSIVEGWGVFDKDGYYAVGHNRYWIEPAESTDEEKRQQRQWILRKIEDFDWSALPMSELQKVWSIARNAT